MLRSKDMTLDFHDPEVLEERNRRIAGWIVKKLGVSEEKIRPISCELNLITREARLQKVQEYIHEKLQTANPPVSREEIHQAVVSCHEDAMDWLQNTYQDLRDS